MAEIVRQEKIDSDFAPPYTPELNGTAERLIKTLQKKIRALMIGSGLPPKMWVLAAEAAVHVYNRTPHKGINFQTPLSVLNSEKNNYLGELKRFGCVAYIGVPLPENKFSDRAIKAILVGHTPTGYLMWHPQTNKFITSIHVRFTEKIVYEDLKSRLFETRQHSEPEASEDTSIPEPEINTEPTTKLQNNKPTKRKNQESVVTNTKVRKMPERK